MLDILYPISDHLQMEVGRISVPSTACLLKYAENLVASKEQQSVDFTASVSSIGVIVGDLYTHMRIDISGRPNISVDSTEASVRKSALKDFMTQLYRMQSDGKFANMLSTSAFGLCSVLKEYMLNHTRVWFAATRALHRVTYPTLQQVEHDTFCKVLYLRDDIMKNLKQVNSVLYSLPELPTLQRMRHLVSLYSFSDLLKDRPVCRVLKKIHEVLSPLCVLCRGFKGKALSLL
jgi:hypothetical protein